MATAPVAAQLQVAVVAVSVVVLAAAAGVAVIVIGMLRWRRSQDLHDGPGIHFILMMCLLPSSHPFCSLLFKASLLASLPCSQSRCLQVCQGGKSQWSLQNSHNM
ncbi:hypothetical protein DFH07DRAFT_803204, partial [Mycena maculata]